MAKRIKKIRNQRRSVHHPFNFTYHGASEKGATKIITGGPGKRFWKITNKSSKTGPAHVYVYDEISFMGITADDFVSELREITSDKIVLHVNSPGGDVFDGLAMYNSLKACNSYITAKIEGLAASAASFFIMAADRIEIARNAEMMIHNAQSICIGDADVMMKQGELLAAQNKNIADIYVQRAGGSQKKWLDLMAAETWYIGQSAVDAGLADAIISNDDSEDDDDDEDEDEDDDNDGDGKKKMSAKLHKRPKSQNSIENLDFADMFSNAFSLNGGK